MIVEIFEDGAGKKYFKFDLRLWETVHLGKDEAQLALQKDHEVTVRHRFVYLFNLLKTHRVINKDETLEFVDKEYTADELAQFFDNTGISPTRKNS